MESLLALISLAISGILFIAYSFKSRQARRLEGDLLRKSNELATTILEHKLGDLSSEAEKAKEKHESASERYRDYLKHHVGDDTDGGAG